MRPWSVAPGPHLPTVHLSEYVLFHPSPPAPRSPGPPSGTPSTCPHSVPSLSSARSCPHLRPPSHRGWIPATTSSSYSLPPALFPSNPSRAEAAFLIFLKCVTVWATLLLWEKAKLLQWICRALQDRVPRTLLSSRSIAMLVPLTPHHHLSLRFLGYALSQGSRTILPCA